VLNTPVVRCQPVTRRRGMTVENVCDNRIQSRQTAKNKHTHRVITHGVRYDSRFTTLAFLPNYRLIKISRRHRRNATHRRFYLFTSHTRCMCIGQFQKYFMQIFAYASVKNKNRLSNLSTQPYRVCRKILWRNCAHGFPRITSEHVFRVIIQGSLCQTIFVTDFHKIEINSVRKHLNSTNGERRRSDI
jgi:hypothetical protein